MIELKIKKTFRKKVLKLNSKMQNKVRLALRLFVIDSYAQKLRRHKLHGKFDGFESIDAAPDLRILIRPQTNEIVDVVDIGNHGYFYD